MNRKLVIALATFAAVTAGAARADDADASQYGVKFEGSRTRAEVQAEARAVPTTRSLEPAGSRVQAPLRSGIDAKLVRSEAAEAVRLGKTRAGEVTSL